MGIRFLCPNGHKLNVKSFLAGRRGICPRCDARFYIPNQSMPNLRVTAVPKRESSARAEVKVELQDPVAQQLPATAETEPLTAAEPVPKQQAAENGEGVWYVRGSDGNQYGPADDRLMERWVQERRVPEDALVWREGWAEWRRAGEVFPAKTATIGSEFDFDPSLLRPRQQVAEVVEVPLDPSEPVVTESRRRPRSRKQNMILALIVAVVALAPVVIYVLIRSMSG